MKRFFALVLAIVLICCTFTSCDAVLAKFLPKKEDDPLTLIEKADAAMDEAPFIANMKTEVTTDNEDIKYLLSGMNFEMPITIDGENISMTTKMDLAQGYSANIKLVIVDKVMYYSLSLPGQTARLKAEMTDEQYKDFMGDTSVDPVIEAEDFEIINVSNVSGGKRIYCSQIKESAKEKVIDAIDTDIDDITVSDVSYTMIIKDGKYESASMVLTCSFEVYGQTYTFTQKTSAIFSYDDVPSITVPADAQKYQTVDYDDLMG